MAVIFAVPVWLCLPAGSSLRRAVAIAGWQTMLLGFDIRLRCHGVPPCEGLVVANHMSWVDIVVLGRLCDAAFVAKAEIAGWPAIGFLAGQYGCAFIDRSRRAAVKEFADRTSPASLILFPEGTTGDGGALLPFHSGLFPSTGRLSPVTIVYRHRDGSALTPAERRKIAWIGDDALLPHAFALATSRGIMAEVWFEPPISAANRKEAAADARAVIARRLEGAQAAARNLAT